MPEYTPCTWRGYSVGSIDAAWPSTKPECASAPHARYSPSATSRSPRSRCKRDSPTRVISPAHSRPRSAARPAHFGVWSSPRFGLFKKATRRRRTFGPVSTSFLEFQLERWMSIWEPRIRVNLCDSGVAPISMHELLALSNGSLDDLSTLRLAYGTHNGSYALREAIAAQYAGTTAD